MQWNSGVPSNDDLHVVFKRGEYEVLGGIFIVWDGTTVTVDGFKRPPKGSIKPSKDSPEYWYRGYWDRGSVRRWMKMPDPPKESEDDAT